MYVDRLWRQGSLKDLFRHEFRLYLEKIAKKQRTNNRPYTYTCIGKRTCRRRFPGRVIAVTLGRRLTGKCKRIFAVSFCCHGITSSSQSPFICQFFWKLGSGLVSVRGEPVEPQKCPSTLLRA